MVAAAKLKIPRVPRGLMSAGGSKTECTTRHTGHNDTMSLFFTLDLMPFLRQAPNDPWKAPAARIASLMLLGAIKVVLLVV